MERSASLQLRGGFSLVEAVVAVLLLTVVVTALAAHLFQVSRRGVVVENDDYRQALIASELDRLTAVPFDLLEDNGWRTANADWKTSDEPPFPHRRKVLVDESADGRALELRLIIEQDLPVERVDTVLLVRPRPVGGNPFSSR